MRGSLWTLAVVAIFAGLLLRAVNISMPAASVTTTVQSNVGAILDMTAPVAGLLILMVGIGAMISLSFARGF